MKLKLLFNIWLFVLGFLCFGSFYSYFDHSRINLTALITINSFFLINILIYFLFIKKIRLLTFKILNITINLLALLVLFSQLIAYSFTLYKGATDLIGSTEIINLVIDITLAILPVLLIYRTIKLTKETYHK